MLEKLASAVDEYGQHLRSHINATISLRKAAQEIRKGVEGANRILSYLYRDSVNSLPKLDLQGQYLLSSHEE